MSQYTKMSPEAIARLKEQGIIQESPSGKPIAWKLAWDFCGKEHLVLPRGTYAQCAGKRKWAKAQPQYKKGELVIRPLY